MDTTTNAVRAFVETKILNGGERLRTTQIAKATGVSASTALGTLHAMEAEGLLSSVDFGNNGLAAGTQKKRGANDLRWEANAE